MAPSRMRLPFPWVALTAVVGLLASEGRQEHAVALILSFICYLRPGELEGLTHEQLVAPTAAGGERYSQWGLLLFPEEGNRASKTGKFDEAILIDHCQWVYEFLAQIKARNPNAQPQDRLWSFPVGELKEVFEDACRRLGLSHLQPCLYGLRHGGASEDLATKRRTLPEAKRRGRWAADSSLARYAKETRLMKEVGRLPAAVIIFGRQVEENILQVLRGTLRLRPPRA